MRPEYDYTTLQHRMTLQRLHVVDVAKQLCWYKYKGKKLLPASLVRLHLRDVTADVGKPTWACSHLHKASARFSKLVNSASGCAKNPGYGVPSRFM